MIPTLEMLGQQKALVVAPVGSLELPLPDSLGVLDFLLFDPIAKAIRNSFFNSDAGEILWVAPGKSPLAGIVLLGYGRQAIGWDKATDITVNVLPDVIPAHIQTIALLPPQPIQGRLPAPWVKAVERFIPSLKKTMSYVKKWHFIDLVEETK